MSCAAHNLALVQKWAFNEQEKKEEPDPIPSISSLLSASKALVTHVKRAGLNKDLDSRLKQEIDIRWDTHFEMLESILINYESLDKKPELKSQMDAIDKGLLINLVPILKELKILRSSLCSDNNATFHLVTIVYEAIMDKMKIKDKDSVPIAVLKRRIVAFLNTKYKISPYHVLATFLSPVFRNRRFPDDGLNRMAKNLLDLYVNEEVESGNEEVIEKDQEADESNPFAAFQDKPYIASDKDREVDRYEAMKFSAVDIQICPLKFWYTNRLLFPRLSKLALWLHAAPATNSISERSFSAAGNTITANRNRLSDNTVDRLLFLRSNYN